MGENERESTAQGHVIPCWAGCQWKKGLFHMVLVSWWPAPETQATLSCPSIIQSRQAWEVMKKTVDWISEVVGVKDITKPLPLVTHSAKCIHACMESTLQVMHVSRWEKEVIFSEGGCMSSMSIVFWYPVHGNRSAGVYPSCCRLRGKIHPGQETVAYQAQRDRQLWFLQGHDNSWWNQFRLTVFWPLSDTKLCHRAFCLHTLTQRQHHYFNSSAV